MRTFIPYGRKNIWGDSGVVRKSRFYSSRGDKIISAILETMHGKICEVFSSRIGNIGEKRILDLGCGNGEITLRFVQEQGEVSKEVIGVDLSNNMLAKARESKKTLPSWVRKRVKFVRADIAQEFPFPNEYFDIVISSLVLHNLDDERKFFVFKEIARILKNEGQFHLADVYFRTQREKELSTSDEGIAYLVKRSPYTLEQRNYAVKLCLDPDDIDGLKYTFCNEYPVTLITLKKLATRVGFSNFTASNILNFINYFSCSISKELAL